MQASETTVAVVDAGRPEQQRTSALVKLFDRTEQVEHRHAGGCGLRSDEPRLDDVRCAAERGVAAGSGPKRVGEADALRLSHDMSGRAAAAAATPPPALS